jgi:hypothetical protein
MTTSSRPSHALPDIDWVEIPGGDYIYQDGKSRTLPTFYMARYPVTNVRYQAFIDAGGYDDERWWQGIERTQPQESRWPQATRPCTSVNWYEAVAFSRWLSEQLGYTVRLPTEEEWERAARGRDGRAFPWGDDYSTGYANINETWDSAGGQKLEHTTDRRRLSAGRLERRRARPGRQRLGMVSEQASTIRRRPSRYQWRRARPARGVVVWQSGRRAQRRAQLERPRRAGRQRRLSSGVV